MFTQDGFTQDGMVEGGRSPTNGQKGLWQLLWEHSPFGMVVMDLDLHVQCVNPAFCEFFNLKPEDIVGRKVGNGPGKMTGHCKKKRRNIPTIIYTSIKSSSPSKKPI